MFVKTQDGVGGGFQCFQGKGYSLGGDFNEIPTSMGNDWGESLKLGNGDSQPSDPYGRNSRSNSQEIRDVTA